MKSSSNDILLHLMRKETKQLFPLIAMLSVIGLALQCFDIYLKIYTPRPSGLAQMILVGMPCLFAIGVGAMLVGQEKDSRTLQWLRSLPVRKDHLVLSKLIVALLSLTLVWTLSWIVFLVPRQLFLPGSIWESLGDSYFFATPTNIVMAVVNTLFLTLCGMALAWRSQRSFTALVAIIPVASVPWLLAIAISYFITKQFDVHSTSPVHEWLTDACLVVATLVAFVRNWFFGLHALGPAAAPKRSRVVNDRALAARKVIPWTLFQPQNQILALTRQFAYQNRLSLMILGGILLVTAIIPGVIHRCNPSGEREYGDDVAFLICACLVTSWLGVLSFHGDRLQHRIRFLSDRGVSPFLVWRTRHSIPVAMLCVCVLVYFLLDYIFVAVQSERPVTRPVSLNFIYLAGVSAGVLGVLLTVYSFSQWVGQWISSPIVAAIIAPACCVLTGIYASNIFIALGASVFFFPLMAIIPMVVTARMMTKWMDGKLGMRFHLQNSMWVIICSLVPVIPLVLHWATSPRIPPSLHAHLYQRAVSLPGWPSPAGLSMDHFQEARKLQGSLFAKNLSATKFREVTRNYRELLTSYVSEHDVNESSVVRFLEGELAFDRLRMERARNDETIDQYRESFGLMVHFAEVRRKSLILIAQELADVAEIVLLHELQRPAALEDLGEETYRKTVESLADAKYRDQSRRNALAVSWAIVNRNSNLSFGGYRFPLEQPSFLRFRNPQGWIWNVQVIGVKVTHLWELLEAQETSQVLSARSAVWKDWLANYPTPQSEWMDLKATSTYAHSFVPGYHWRGQWEEDAIRLKQSLNELPSRKSKTTQSEEAHE